MLTTKTTTQRRRTGSKPAAPAVHPGEILREDILPEAGLSISAAARALGVSRQMLHGVIHERRPLSPIMCLRVARLFGGSPERWVRLQAAYDLKIVEADKSAMRSLSRIVPLPRSAA